VANGKTSYIEDADSDAWRCVDCGTDYCYHCVSKYWKYNENQNI